MIEIATFATRTTAEVAQAAFDAAGIRSALHADDAGGAYPFDLAGGPRLLVNDADAEQAAAILAYPTQKPERSRHDIDGHGWSR